ncbi:hypothetical protein Dimus_004095 [Dionaea muscipula]
MHGYGVRNDLFLNVSLTTSLIVMYSKYGTLEYSRRLFEGLDLDQRNVISWTAMIDSSIHNGCLHEAHDVFRAIQLSKHQPDSVTISRVLRICGELRTLSLGKEIHGQVLKKDMELVPFVNFCWYLENMVSKGCTPSRFTFSVALSICNQAGFVDEACRIFKSMTQVFGIEPDEGHHAIMNQLLTRLGRVDKADKGHVKEVLKLAREFPASYFARSKDRKAPLHHIVVR